MPFVSACFSLHTLYLFTGFTSHYPTLSCKSQTNIRNLCWLMHSTLTILTSLLIFSHFWTGYRCNQLQSCICPTHMWTISFSFCLNRVFKTAKFNASANSKIISSSTFRSPKAKPPCAPSKLSISDYTCQFKSPQINNLSPESIYPRHYFSQHDQKLIFFHHWPAPRSTTITLTTINLSLTRVTSSTASIRRYVNTYWRINTATLQCSV